LQTPSLYREPLPFVNYGRAQPLGRAQLYNWVSSSLPNGTALRAQPAKSKLNHVIGGAVTVPFVIRTPSIMDDRPCSYCRLIAGGS
jgi:hypothetical protein